MVRHLSRDVEEHWREKKVNNDHLPYFNFIYNSLTVSQLDSQPSQW